MAQTVRDMVEALFAIAAPEQTTALYLIPQTAEGKADLSSLETAPETVRAWAAGGFTGAEGAFSLAPGPDGRPVAALAGVGLKPMIDSVGGLPSRVPARFGDDGAPLVWALHGPGLDPGEAALEWALGAYRFERYRKNNSETPLLVDPEATVGAAARNRLVEIAASVWMARNLVNTPTSDLGPEELEAVVANQAERHGAALNVIVGDDLLEQGFPMIHAVGRAGAQEPRLIDLTWTAPGLGADAPKVTIVGKGVCFDTGGLNLKPGGSMRLMKKDMGGSAASLALARMIMTLALPVRLRLLIPAVENNVDAISFRPGDVLISRKGLTVEIDNTDAEGRLVLADAMALADEEAPDLMIDMATLTGAARVALGPEIAPFFTADDSFAQALAESGEAMRDPLWRMPLWDGYERDLSSTIADCVNSAKTGLGGSITAALFLRRFVEKTKCWAHFDVFGWNSRTRPGRPEGGEATAARAIFHALERRYGSGA